MNKSTIGDICSDMHSGGTPSTKIKEYRGGKIPWLSSSESGKGYINESSQYITELGVKNSATKLARKNSVIIATAGEGKTRGQVSFLNIDAYINQSIIAMYPDENKMIPKYLYFYLKNNYKKIRSLSDITGIRGSLSGDLLKQFEIFYPSLNEQRKIVRTLSSIDDKIELNNKTNSELEAIARELYEYRFVQFDFPDKNGMPYKSSGGKMVWNDELKREIPDGREVKTLGDIFKKNTKGISPKNTIYTIDLSIMPSDTMCLGDKNSSDNFSTNLFEMKKFDILFGGIRPYLKKAGFAPCDGVNAGTVHSFSVINEYDYNFALLTIVSESMFNFAIANSKGTKMPVVSADDLLTYKFPYDEKLSKKFNEIVSFREIIANNIMENHQLSELRDFLLPMLMNGQVAVK